ncbi:MAG: transcriptional regulator [Actinophytocola sp.]|uniref:winged helix-turn-helix transcriptional regulator n=1 Tax=Actinophytocola sp. TaxID=1872138 RepID=UPI0013262631|nr:helix-turn-helix domain-containing protein [Actinophytocola sp.]MPZ80983.1 transcriptional regulator [Actinophytocola sp.]
MQVQNAESARLCFARQILDRVGDKWSIAVIHSLGATTMRFTELKREIEGISQRMLTATLRTLERDGLVHRTVHPVVPPRVDYRLTELGLTLLDTVCDLMGWAVEHADDIGEARAEYDARLTDQQSS